MLAAILKLLGIDPFGKLLGTLGDAYKAKLDATNDADRIAADVTINGIEAQIAISQQAAAVVQSGMQHPLFWIAWSIAALPLAAWFAWGVLDSMLGDILPDTLPMRGQLAEFAVIVWGNIFYAGGAVAATTALSNVVGKIAARR